MLCLIFFFFPSGLARKHLEATWTCARSLFMDSINPELIHITLSQIADDSLCGWAFKCLNFCLLHIHHRHPSRLYAFPQLLSLYTNYCRSNSQAKLLKIIESFASDQSISRRLVAHLISMDICIQYPQPAQMIYCYWIETPLLQYWNIISDGMVLKSKKIYT